MIAVFASLVSVLRDVPPDLPTTSVPGDSASKGNATVVVLIVAAVLVIAAVVALLVARSRRQAR
jgi:hypothetical protein